MGKVAQKKELVEDNLLKIKQELNKLSNDPAAREAPDFDQRVQDLTQQLVKSKKLQDILNSPMSLEQLSDDDKDLAMRIMFANKTKRFKQ